MLLFIWNELLTRPLFNALMVLHHYTGNLGLSIILLTIILKTILIPANIPTLKMSSKKSELDEELKKLKEKYKDKKELAQKQMELYKKHGINPASGCLPNIIQLLVIVALYRVFMNILTGETINEDLFYFSFLHGITIDHVFLYLDLFKPDPYFLLPALAAIVQFFLSKMLIPSVKKSETIAKKTTSDMDDIMLSMQEQMLYITPIMTFIIGFNLASGLILYWFISSLYSWIQNLLLKRFIFSKKDKELQ